MIDLKISLVGFVIGILVGLTGVGGGVLMTPLLIVGCGVRPAGYGTGAGGDEIGLGYGLDKDMDKAAEYFKSKGVDITCGQVALGKSDLSAKVWVKIIVNI